MNKQTIFILVVLAVAIGAYFSPATAQPAQPAHLGAEGDSNMTNLVLSGTLTANTSTIGNVTENATIASLTLTTTTPTSSLTGAQVCGSGVIQFPMQTSLSNITTGTVTFPASSTMNACIAVGAHRTITIQNLGTSTSTVTFQAGNGGAMRVPFNVSSTLTVPGGQQAFVDIVNGNGTDTIEFIQSF